MLVVGFLWAHLKVLPWQRSSRRTNVPNSERFDRLTGKEWRLLLIGGKFVTHGACMSGGTVRWCNTSRFFFVVVVFFLPVVVVLLTRERKLSHFIPALLSISFMIHTLSPHLPIKAD